MRPAHLATDPQDPLPFRLLALPSMTSATASPPAAAAPPTSTVPTLSPLDPREFRRALGSFATGVTVVTTVGSDGQLHGLTANSFSSVSLDPPLVLWCQSVKAPSHPVFSSAPRFAINILAEEQVEVSRRFATGGKDKFADIDVRTGLDGVPLIPGCAAHLECSLVASYPGGDHVIFVGRVERFEFNAARPLVFGRGRYQSAQPHEVDASTPELHADSRTQLQAVAMATTAAADLSHSLNAPVALAVSVWGNHGPTVIRWETPRHRFPAKLRAGSVSSLLTSATGLAYAAFGRAPELQRMLQAELEDQLPQDGTGHTPESLSGLLAEVRSHGLARVVGSTHFRSIYAGPINAVCAPVFDSTGDMVAGLTATAVATELDVEWDAPIPLALRATAADLSRRLGCLGTGRP